MNSEHLRKYIAEIPNFPKQGVVYRDLSSLFTLRLDDTATALLTRFGFSDYDTIAGIESRGFILGAAMAIRADKKFLPIRKGWKVPEPRLAVEYQTEYSQDELAIRYMGHDYGRILIVDDVLATGGTLKAAAELCQLLGHKVAGFGVIVDLKYLNQFEYQGQKCQSLVAYES